MKEITAALVKLQSELRPARYDSENPHFKAKYASLTSIIEASRDLLAKNGLAITQTIHTGAKVDYDSGEVVGAHYLTTTLLHVSGESIESVMRIEPTQNTPQSFGSALTYARRYSWSAIIGMSADEDDDGNAASTEKQTRKQEPKKEPAKKEITPEMVSTLKGLLMEGYALKLVDDPNAELPADYDTFVAMGKDLRQMINEAKK